MEKDAYDQFEDDDDGMSSVEYNQCLCRLFVVPAKVVLVLKPYNVLRNII